MAPTTPYPVMPAGVNVVSSDSFSKSVSTFVSTHKKAVIAVAGTLAVGSVAAAGYYYYNSPSSSSSSSTTGPTKKDGEGKKKKKKKSKKAGSSLEEENGPLLEEVVTPKTEKETSATGAGESKKAPAATVEEKKEDDLPNPSAAEIAAMDQSDRSSLSTLFKTRGNSLYQAKKFSDAIEMYTRAIAVSSGGKEGSVFYSNRAACYNQLTPPDHEKVVADCDSALALDATYIKALNRRAGALLALNRLHESIRDYTAVTILDQFKNPQSATAVENVLRQLATKEAKERLDSRDLGLPSGGFIKAYLAAFRKRDPPTLSDSPSQGDSTLLLAFDALEAGDYIHAFSFTTESLAQGLSTPHLKSEALNLSGTFKFLLNDSAAAKKDLEESCSLNPEFIQSWVKVASVHMELGDPTATFGDFESAIKYNPNDPDIYYHRGQVYFIMNEFEKALEDYSKSSELDPTFIFSHIQKAVAQYKMGNSTSSMAAFRRVLKEFPGMSEPHNYYGELLLDQQRFSDAMDKFDKAIEIESANKKFTNVLPMVNKAHCLLQWKQDLPGAERLIVEALKIDPDCDIAVITLAQLSLQQGKVDQAVEMFARAAKMARTEVELVNALTYEYASKAQLEFIANYPTQAAMMGQIAAQMGQQ